MATFVLLAALLQPASAGASPLELEGAATIDRIWSANLRTCGGLAFYAPRAQTVIELDRPVFQVAGTRLTEAAKQSGYEFQATAVASAVRWRWAPIRKASVGRWSAWSEGADLDVRVDNFGIGREHALVRNAVLHFEVARKDGRWSAYRPLSPVNAISEPTTIDAVWLNALPSCSKLTGRR